MRWLFAAAALAFASPALSVSVTTKSSGSGSPTGAAGGDLTGTYPNPTIGASAVTNSKVAAGAFSNITGVGTQAQALNMNSNAINNVTDPAAAQDALTLNYFNNNIPKTIPTKLSARLATAAALPTNVYANGASGVGATLTGTALGALTVDGVATAVGDRVLVKNEAAALGNGIYRVTTTAGGSFFVLTRATDFDSASEMIGGTALYVDSGTANTDDMFVLVATITTVGTDSIFFTRTSIPNAAASGANADIGSLAGAGASVTVSTSLIVTSTMNVQGNAFSVGTSTFVVSAGSVAIGASAPTSAANLWVKGSEQVGIGAIQSTFTAGGSINVGYGVTATTGVFQSTLTVVGNAFSVGTSTFVVFGSSIGIQVTVANLISSSAMTVGGNVSIQGKTNLGAGGLVFPDATTQTTAATASVIKSTMSYPNMATANTVAGFGITNSTMSITTGNNGLMICFAGNAQVSGVANIQFGVLLDGAIMTGWKPANAQTTLQTPASGLPVTMSFCVTTNSAVSAATHTVGLWASTNSATLTIPSTGSGNTVDQFWVLELNTGNY